MQSLLDQLTNVNPLKDILIPMTAAAAAIWLALKKFKRERLWQEKYAAYQEVLGSVEALSFWADQATAEGVMMPTLEGDAVKSVQDEYSHARRRIVKHATLGQLLLSRSTMNVLEEFRVELYREDYRANEEYSDTPFEEHANFHIHAKEVKSIVAKYLPRIVEHARSDLGV